MKLAPAPADAAIDGPFITHVDQQLRRCLDEHRARLAAIAPGAAEPVDELRRVIDAGGKRVRPLFCLWGYRAAGGQDVRALGRVGAALEMLHTAALIHDDVLDRSRLRRGRPSSYRRLGDLAPEHAERFGAAAAILAGDLAQALSDELLAGSAFPPERIVAAARLVDRARVDAVTGEFLDLLAVAHIRKVAALKSGSYSVVGPLLVGATLAGAADGLLDALRGFGEPLGEAFQLRDDVLGTFGDRGATGKDPDDDLREGKRTLLLARATATASKDDRELLASLAGREDLLPAEADRARAAVVRSGAPAAVTALIDELAVRAVRALDRASMPDDVRAALEGLAERVALRLG